MIRRRNLIAVLTAAVVLSLAVGVSASSSLSSTDLVWNPGPSYFAGIHTTMVPDGQGGYQVGCASRDSDMSQAQFVGSPKNQVRADYQCYPNTIPAASNGAAPSYYITAFVGWTTDDLDAYPGYSVWNLGGGGGTPISFEFLNKALLEPDPCTLREVGLSYQKWSRRPSQFRSNQNGKPFTMRQFSSVNASLTAQVVDASGPPACTSLPTGYVSADFHVAFPNNSTDYILGVLLYVMPGTPVPASGPFFWRSSDQTKQILLGSRIGVPQLTAGGDSVSYSLDFKSLVASYVTPPAGYSTDDAIISGLDVYSSVRGADLDFVLTNTDVAGTS